MFMLKMARLAGGMHVRIGILAYDGCLPSQLFGFRDLVLLGARLAPAPAPLEVQVVTASGESATAAGAVSIVPSGSATGCDLLVAPGFDIIAGPSLDDQLAGAAAEIELLRARHAAGAHVASICVGAFLLAEADLLDGRRCTTAWLFADALAHRRPRARVDRNALIVTDGAVTTAGAFTAAQDLALHVVEAGLGEAAARALRNVALLESGRASQAPFVDPALLARRGERFSERVEGWLLQRLAEPYSLAVLAEGVAASRRTVLRRYRHERARSPLKFLQEARVDRAKRLLEETGLSIAEIAHAVGYEDVSSFATLFARIAGTSPGAYRRRFAGSLLAISA